MRQGIGGEGGKEEGTFSKKVPSSSHFALQNAHHRLQRLLGKEKGIVITLCI